jgi:hypothetical protein
MLRDCTRKTHPTHTHTPLIHAALHPSLIPHLCTHYAHIISEIHLRLYEICLNHLPARQQDPAARDVSLGSDGRPRPKGDHN